MGNTIKQCLGDFYPKKKKNNLTESPNPIASPRQQEAAGGEASEPLTGANRAPAQGDDRPLPASKAAASAEGNITGRVSFGAGCYWGTEKFLRHNFATKTSVPGRIEHGQVGFMGPKSAPTNPSYEDVCTGATGHVEVYDLEFQGGEAYFEAMVRFFFQFHDPTTLNKQGNDGGTQYASVIYCYDRIQHRIATKVKAELQQLLTDKLVPEKTFKGATVTTDIRMVEAPFFPAHEAHQDYLMKNPRCVAVLRCLFFVPPHALRAFHMV
jgi:peptide-methionine (S)-S-oxide reductase